MNSRIAITVVVLVIAPTAILSMLAWRALRSHGVIMDQRLSASADETLREISGDVQQRLSVVREDLATQYRAIWQSRNYDLFLQTAAAFREAHPIVDQVYLFEIEDGLVYPRAMIGVPPQAESDAETDRYLEVARKFQFEKQDMAAAIGEYRRIAERFNYDHPVLWEAVLGLSQCYGRMGQPSSAIRWLDRAVAVFANETKGRQVRDAAGYMYDLTVLRELTDLYEQAGQLDRAIENELRLFSIVVRRFPSIVALQREEMLKHIRRWTRRIVEIRREAGSGRTPAANDAERSELESLHALLKECEQNLRDTDQQRAAIERAVWATVEGPEARRWVQVGSRYYAFVALDAGETFYVGLRIATDAAAAFLVPAAEKFADPSGFVLYAMGRPVVPGRGDAAVDRTMGAALSTNLPPPLSFLTIDAYAADPSEVQSRRDLQAQLYVWGIALLVLGIGLGVVTLFAQVTDELRKAKARSEFVAAISHDIRTPLSSMRMLSESLYYGNVRAQERRQEFLSTIVRECDRLSQMVDRVLYFVRLGQNALTYSLRPESVHQIVEEAVQIARERVAHKKAEIGLEIEGELPIMNVDADAIQQVLLNLLDNAVKYSGDDIDVKVNVRAVDGGVRISVKDSGVGMTRAESRRVFRRYYRARREREGTTTGVGLGLSLCRHIVRAHGGRIMAESELGFGSTFHVTLMNRENRDG
tara:strand:+ start:1299 stop:3401 length:2103 start_codon:yes stop_codon:yes gene_type:complete